MAFTVSNLVRNVNGMAREHCLRVTADAATDSIDTGLSYIYGLSGFVPQSMTTSYPKFKINALSAGTAANGFLAITNCTSTDVFFITVYGR